MISDHICSLEYKAETLHPQLPIALGGLAAAQAVLD